MMTNFEVIDYLLNSGRNIENILFEKDESIIYLNSGENYRIKTTEISLNFLLKKLNSEKERIINKGQELKEVKTEKLTKLIIISLAIILIFAIYGFILIVSDFFSPLSLLAIILSAFGEYVLLGSIKKAYDEYKNFSNTLNDFIKKDNEAKINMVIKNFDAINLEIEKRRNINFGSNSFQNFNLNDKNNYTTSEIQRSMSMKKVA